MTKILFQKAEQILAILVFLHRSCNLPELVGCYPTVFKCDSLQTGDFKACAFLNCLNENGCIGEAVVRPGIEPGETSPQILHSKSTLRKIFLINRGDFQFSSSGRLDVFCNLHHTVRIEIQSYYSIVAFRMFRFFLNAETVTVSIKFSDSISLRVAHVVSEYSCLVLRRYSFDGIIEFLAESCAIEDIVSKDKANIIISDKLRAYYEGLGKSVRGGCSAYSKRTP